MTLETVVPGQDLDIRADNYNRIIAGTKWVEKQQLNIGAMDIRRRRSGIVKIRNKSGADQKKNAVLAIDEPLVVPDDNLDAFRGREPEFDCILWTDVSGDLFRQPIVILQEPINNNSSGLAMIFGVTPVKLEIDNALHWFAKPTTASDKLITAYAGPANIIWKPSGAGEKWGIVEIGNYPWINSAPENPYVIDRTDPDDDSKTWNPLEGEPSDWASYDGLRLKIQTLRYLYDVGGTTIEVCVHTHEWLTPYAPIIQAFVDTSAETDTC